MTEYFGGCPRQWLFDNPKTVVLARADQEARFHPALLEAAVAPRVQPRLCTVRKPTDKGKVEQAIRYLRERFLAGRTISSVAQGNAELYAFLHKVTAARPHPAQHGVTVEQVFQAERPTLLALPAELPSGEQSITTRVDRQAFVQFETNRRSVLPEHAGKPVTLRVSDEHLYVLADVQRVATHARCYAKHQRLELPEHRAKVLAQRCRARETKGRDRLLAAAPRMDAMMSRSLPPQGFVQRPLDAMKAALTGGLPTGFNAFGGVSQEAPFGNGVMGRSMEQAMTQNPNFEAHLEQALGGRILPDGANDGTLSVYRPPYSQVGGLMKNLLASGGLANTGIASSLAGLGVAAAGNLATGVSGSILSGLQRMEANVASFASGLTGSGSAAQLAAEPQAQTMANAMGIDVRNASFEDIIALLLMKCAKNKETDVMKKVQDLDKSMPSANSKDSTSSNGLMGGLLGGGGGAVGNALGGDWVVQWATRRAHRDGHGPVHGRLPDVRHHKAAGLAEADERPPEDPRDAHNMMKSMHDMQMSPIRTLRG